MPALSEVLRRRVDAEPVARLATLGPAGAPHLVVITFALADPRTLVTAVDAKPKRTTDLQRLRNLRRDPRVSVLVDHYEPDWSRLWWVRLDGVAEVVDEGRRRGELLEPLVAKYPAYREAAPQGAVVAVAVERVATWSASARGADS